MRRFAPAKVNLALHVTGRRPDGYHLLDSLVVFVDVGDWVTVQASDEMSLSVVGPRADGVPVDARNLMWQAAQHRGCTAKLELEKHLPHAGGIGGGSSDAAATIRALEALYGWDAAAPERALPLGADVPVCLHGRPCQMSGIGEVIEDVPSLPPLWCVLANPGIDVPTGPVFRALISTNNRVLPEPGWSTSSDFFAWLHATRNDLEPPARQLVPEIHVTLDALAAQTGAKIARMSGSGGTCFALFESAQSASNAAATLATEHPTWWVAAAKVLSEENLAVS